MQTSSGQAVGAGHPSVPDAFRDFMSTYFTGVTIVTSIDSEGRPHGLTCNSLSSVTLSPPTLLVCLNLHSGTLAAVRSRAEFAVNLLHTGGRGAAEVFASPRPCRFERIAWRCSTRFGVPWLVDDARAIAECSVVDITVVGDHAVVFGQVVNVEHRPDGGLLSPLLYGMRAFVNGAPGPGSAPAQPPTR